MNEVTAVEQSRRLEAIVETIVQTVRPEQVILFGSRAQETARSESDYDFLVVMAEKGNGREVSRRIYHALLERKLGAAVDVVVVDRETLRRHGENPFYVYRQALRERVVSYDLRGDRTPNPSSTSSLPRWR